MQKSLITACLALVAFAAFAIAPALASASPALTQDNNGVPLIGPVKVEGTSEGVTKMTTSLGNIECQDAFLTGTVTENSGTSVTGDIETAEFFNTETAGGKHIACSTAFLGNVTVTPKKLPWCIKANNKMTADTWELKSGACTGALGGMEFTLDSSTVGECSYTKTAVTGSFETKTAGALTVSGQEFVKSAGSGFCPGSGKLDMTFQLYTDGKAHTAANSINLS